MPRVPELGRRRRGDAHQEPASGSTGCPEHGPRLRGSAPSPKALWSQGSDSEKRCPGEATLQSCSLKNLSNKDLQKQAPGRARRRPNTTGPASGARGRCQASCEGAASSSVPPLSGCRDRGSEPAPCPEARKPCMRRSKAQAAGERSHVECGMCGPAIFLEFPWNGVPHCSPPPQSPPDPGPRVSEACLAATLATSLPLRTLFSLGRQRSASGLPEGAGGEWVSKGLRNKGT